MPELLLGVNIDHIATLRNARGSSWPDPVQAAFIAEQAGADSITVHLREDRRHINDRDVQILRQTIEIRINLEISMTEEMIAIACRLEPHCCCIVPEKRQEITTEGGLNLEGQKKKVHHAITRLSDVGTTVSLFINADQHQIAIAADIGAPCIEIHTGAYALASNAYARTTELERIRQGVEYAISLGVTVNAGHGLNYHNVKPIAALPSIHELNIGHAIISRAVIAGLAEAVKDMRHLLYEARQ